MKPTLLACLLLLLAACATREPHCEGALRPIGAAVAPAVAASAEAGTP